MDDVIGLLLLSFSIIMLALAILIAVVQGRRSEQPFGAVIDEQLFRWISLLAAGVVGVYTFVVHVFFAETSAAGIGWEVSPFQYEVGVADLGFGVLSMLAFRASYDFRLASVVGISIWLWGDAIGHIRQMVIAHNFEPGNAGPWFWSDVLVPLALVILIIRLRPALSPPSADQASRG